MAARTKKFLKVIEGMKTWNVSSSQPYQSNSSGETDGRLKAEHFQVKEIAIHGFPYRPSCFAVDCIQKLMAVGTKVGAIRIFGRPGVDYAVSHPSSSAVLQLIFLVNEGGLISICHDNVVHLWNIRQKNPELVHSLQFKREHLTCGHVPMGSSWLYVGTDKGNVHFVDVRSFTTSGYVINWNKAIDLSQASHPGRVIQIVENPQDSNKLLIGYSGGLLALWDLATKSVEARFKCYENLNGFCWHWEGKTFMACHDFGILATWTCRQPQQPSSLICPHSGSGGLPDDYSSFESISSVEWLPSKNGESLIVFTGGCRLSTSGQTDSSSRHLFTRGESVDPVTSEPTFLNVPTAVDPADLADRPSSSSSLSIKRGKRLVVMQMDHTLIQFMSLCSSPYVHEFMDPHAIAVLLENDLVMVDLYSPNFVTFENPYPMDLHIPPVTCCLYLVDCPGDLIPAFYSVGTRSGRPRSEADSFSTREWPITGGEWGLSCNSYPELVLTGHSDGSIRFWDASEATLTPLYRIRTQKYFFKPCTKSRSPNEQSTRPTPSSASDDINANVCSNLLSTEEDPYAVRLMHFCCDSRKLAVASLSHACVLQFSKREQQFEIPVLDVCMSYESLDELSSVGAVDAFVDDQTGTGTMPARRTQPFHSVGSASSAQSAFTTDRDVWVFVAVQPGTILWSPGYQPSLVCRLGIPALGSDTSSSPLPPTPVTAISLCSAYSLLGIGTEYGFVLVNYNIRACLISTSTVDLLNSSDAFSRPPNRSPGRLPMNSFVEGKSFDKPPRPPPPRLPPQTSTDRTEAHNTVVHKRPAPSIPMRTDSAPPLSVEPTESTVHRTNSHLQLSYCCSCCMSYVPSPEPATSCVLVRPQSRVIDRTSPLPLLPQLTYSTNRSLGRIVDLSEQVTGYSRWSFLVTNLCSDDISLAKLSGSFEQNVPKPVEEFLKLSYLSSLCRSLLLACRPAAAPTHARQEKWSEFSSLSQTYSLSTSVSSLEQVIPEGVKSIVFMSSYARKQDFLPSPTIWLGTTRGNVLVLNLRVSESPGQHIPNPIIPNGSIYRLNGEILFLSFLDMNGDLVSSPFCKWDESSSGVPNTPLFQSSQPDIPEGGSSASLFRQGDSSAAARRLGTDVESKVLREGSSKPHGVPPTRTSSSSTSSSDAPTSGLTDGDKHLIVICSDKQARVLALPSQSCVGKAKITETSNVVCASVQRFRPTSANVASSSATFLACYLANGHFLAFSLPGLKMLMDVDYLPYTGCVSRSFAFGQHGQAVYLASPSELLKITWSADVCSNLRDMQGELFVPCAMPDPPKRNFFKNLLTGNLSTPVDRDELFSGAASGKSMPGTSTLLPSARMDKLTGQAGGATSEIGRARNAAIERGQRLEHLDTQTEEMADQAKGLGRTAALLAAKYEKKDKRWGWPL